MTKFERPQVKSRRVAMLAAMGYITLDHLRFSKPLATSLNLKVAGMPSGLAALSKMLAAGGFRWVFLCGALERGYYRHGACRDPGDFGNFGVLGVPCSESDQDREACTCGFELGARRRAVGHCCPS